MYYCIVVIGGDKNAIENQRFREDNDLKQSEIANILQCDQSLYSKYERGEREIPLKFMVLLAEFYNTSIDYLVGLTDEKKPYKRAISK